MENEGIVYFSLRGDFSPPEVTAQIGIEPTESWSAHERDPARKIPSCSGWTYSTERIIADVVDVYEMSNRLIRALKPYQGKIKSSVTEFDLQATLQVVLHISTDESMSTPAIGFDIEVIDFLSKVGATIDIDTYKNSDPDATGQRR